MSGHSRPGKWQATADQWRLLGPEAKRMRQEPTPAERHLWQRLCRSQILGVKFRRQPVIDRLFLQQ